MTTAVTRVVKGYVLSGILHLALELAEKNWKLAFTTGLGQKPRQLTVPAGEVGVVIRQVEVAKRRFRLPAEVRVVSCYEAGMEGFWLHRALVAAGLENLVVDSASIDVKRRRRRAKTDRLDAAALVQKLVRYQAGDRKVWSVVHVPPEQAEDLQNGFWLFFPVGSWFAAHDHVPEPWNHRINSNNSVVLRASVLLRASV